jgi:hypothetical protein
VRSDTDRFVLEPPCFPIPGAPASVSNGDNLKFSFCNSVNYAVRKPPEEKLSRAVQVHRPSLWSAFDFIDGMIELGHESICGGGIALGIPPMSSPCFRDGFKMDSNAWSGHRIARGFGGAPPTRELSSLFPCPNHRGGVRSLYPMPPQRLHPLSRPGFQLTGRRARLAPRPVGEGPLLRLFWEQTS